MDRRSKQDYWARVIDRAKIYESKIDLRKSYLDMKNCASVSIAFADNVEEFYFGQKGGGMGGEVGRPKTAGDLMAMKRRRSTHHGGEITPSSRRMQGVGFGGEGGGSYGGEFPTPSSRGGADSPFASPKSRNFIRGNFSPKSLSSRRSENNSSSSLRRQTFNAPLFSMDGSSMADTSEIKKAEEDGDDDDEPAVSDDDDSGDKEGSLVNTYRPHSALVTSATTEAMISLREKEPMSMSALIKTGSLSTLNIEGSGVLRPTNTGFGIRQIMKRDRELVDMLGDGAEEDIERHTTKTKNNVIMTGRHSTIGDGKAMLIYEKHEHIEADEHFELSDIQKKRRGVIMGQDVDYSLKPRQKKAMRDLIETDRTKTLIEEKAARRQKMEDDKMRRRVQADWIWNLVASKYFRILGEEFKSLLGAKNNRKRRNDAVQKIQKAWRIYFAPIQMEKKRRIQVTLVKFSFRLLARLSRVRLRLAKRTVLKFYSDFSRQRFAFVMVKFRYNCIKLQRRIRSYHQCTKARVLVLSMLWNSIEPQIKLSIEKEINAHLHGSYADKWKGHISLSRFPELAQKINTVTTNCVALKKTIQKGVNTVGATLPALILEEKRLRAEYHKKMGKGRKQSAIGRAMSEVSQKSMVPEAEKTKVIKQWLTNRRSDHGEYGWNLTRGGKVKATQLNMMNAAKIVSGELDIRDHVEYTNNKILWPTFLMLTDEEGMEEFKEVVTKALALAITKRNDEIQAMVKKRMETEMGNTTLKLGDLPGGYRWINEDDTNRRGGGKKKGSGTPSGKSGSSPEVFGGVYGTNESFVLDSAPVGTPTSNISDKNKRGGGGRGGGVRGGGGGNGGGHGDGGAGAGAGRRTRRVVEPKKKKVTAPPVSKTHALAAPKPVTLEVPNF